MKKKKQTHGGARPGSGAPKKDVTRNVTIRVTQAEKELIHKLRKAP